MDDYSPTCYDEIQELNAEDVNDGITDIGSLPKTVLGHILSFLPTEDAVRTSVLSKRWEFLWTTLPKLYFVEGACSTTERELFMNFIERTLLLHDDCCSIRDFALDCRIMDSASRVKTWVTTVARRNVENCDIRLTKIPELLFVLPRCLFTCDTLVKLILDMRCTLRLPSQIHLPNLKYLHLRYLTFLDEHSTGSLFSSPAIESLHIERCDWVNLRAVTISSPNLKQLSVDEMEANNGCQVMISDCRLESLNLSGPMINEYTASNSCALSVNLSIEHSREVEKVRIKLVKILREIHAIQTLSFKRSTIHFFEDTLLWDYDGSHLPVLSVLNTMKVEYKQGKIGVLGKILQRTPQLQTLILWETSGFCYPWEDADIFDEIPPSFLSNLKKVVIGGLYFEWRDPNLKILFRSMLKYAKLVLKYATALEELVIVAFTEEDDGRLEKFCRKLMRSRRGSINCKITQILHERWRAAGFCPRGSDHNCKTIEILPQKRHPRLCRKLFHY